MTKITVISILSFCCACVWGQSILTAEGLATFKSPATSLSFSNNLVAQYKMNDNGPTATVVDSKGFSDGIIEGLIPPPLKGALNPYGSFMLQVTNIDPGIVVPIGTNDFTIAFWMQTDFTAGVPTSDSFADYLQLDLVNSGSRFLTVRYPQTTNGVYHWSAGLFDEGGIGDCICTNDATLDTNWHLITLSCNRSSSTGLKFYIDANLIDTQDPRAWAGFDYTPSSNYIGVYFNQGAEPSGPVLTYNFYLDQLRILVGTNLSQAQISDIYNGGTGTNVVETNWPASNGFYSEFDDCDAGVWQARYLTNGIWQSCIMETRPSNGNVDCDYTRSGIPLLAYDYESPPLSTSQRHTNDTFDAFVFNGVDYFVTLSNDFRSVFTNSCAINSWVKINEGHPGDPNGILANLSGGQGVEVTIDSNGKLKVRYAVGTIRTYISSTAGFSSGPNPWHMVTVNFQKQSSTTLQVTTFVDGNNIGQSTNLVVTMANFNPNDNMVIGKYYDGGFFDGEICNMMIFNKVLKTNEIAYLYNNGNGTETVP